jgi:hypothetical protein
VLEDDDINELKSCRPYKCQLQLPTESMEEFQKSVDWSAPDVVAQVNKLAQKMALGELCRYQKDGDSALGTYSDKKYPLRERNPVSHWVVCRIPNDPNADLESLETELGMERLIRGQ